MAFLGAFLAFLGLGFRVGLFGGVFWGPLGFGALGFRALGLLGLLVFGTLGILGYWGFGTSRPFGAAVQCLGLSGFRSVFLEACGCLGFRD